MLSTLAVAQDYLASMVDDSHAPRTPYETKGFSAVSMCLGWLGPVLVAQMGDAIFPDVADVHAIRQNAA